MNYNEKEFKELVLQNSKFVDIGGLPSDFQPYPLLKDKKRIYIRPFTIAELKLISKSLVTKDIKHVIRAIDLTIDYDAEDLTIGDFYFVLLWQRLHSFPKSPMMVQWSCESDIFKSLDNTKYLKFGETPEQDLELWEKVKCNTSNAEALHKTNISVYDLPDNTALPEGFDFPRVRDLDDITKSLKDPELSMLVKGIQWIAGTWEEKIKKADGENGVDLYDTGSALAETVVHGIGEYAVLTCRSCSKKINYQLELNAASFFR